MKIDYSNGITVQNDSTATKSGLVVASFQAGEGYGAIEINRISITGIYNASDNYGFDLNALVNQGDTIHVQVYANAKIRTIMLYPFV